MLFSPLNSDSFPVELTHVKSLGTSQSAAGDKAWMVTADSEQGSSKFYLTGFQVSLLV